MIFGQKSWKKFWTCQSSFYSSAVGMEIKNVPLALKRENVKRK